MWTPVLSRLLTQHQWILMQTAGRCHANHPQLAACCLLHSNAVPPALGYRLAAHELFLLTVSGNQLKPHTSRQCSGVEVCIEKSTRCRPCNRVAGFDHGKLESCEADFADREPQPDVAPLPVIKPTCRCLNSLKIKIGCTVNLNASLCILCVCADVCQFQHYVLLAV